MENRWAETAYRDIETLFRFGAVTGLSDGQLLERFAGRPDTDGQIAYEAIMRRHGPMVLGVCLRVLGDYHDAEDAFQATFIVLALRSRAVRKRESLGPWLHGVATRIARRSLASRHRRRVETMPAAGVVDPKAHEPAVAELTGILDEELGRLPDKYRLPVVLCYLEGQTQDEAARTLGWTKGTVSGRLARAKDLLQHRLARRGLAPAAGLLAVYLTSETASAALPPSLVISTVRAATAAGLSGAKIGVITVHVASLARETVKVMALGRLARAVALVLLLTIGATAITTHIHLPNEPARQRSALDKSLASAGRAAGRTSPDARSPRLDRFGDPLPAGVLMRLGTTQRRHTTRVVGVDFTANGEAAVSAQADGLVRFWDPASGRQVRALNVIGGTPGDDKTIKQFAISRDRRYMAAVGFALDPSKQTVVKNLWIWNLPEARPLHTIEVKTVDLYSLAFSPVGGTIATGGSAGEVKLWDIATGACLETLKMGSQPVYWLVFAPDGKTLATGERGKGIRLWDLEQGAETVLASPDASTAPCFSGDGRFLAVNRLGGEVDIWDRRAGRKHRTARGFGYEFAPDSRSLAMIGPDKETLTIIDAESGDELWKTALGPALQVAGLSFSPDGKTIIVGWGNVLRFFEAGSGRERFVSPEAHQGSVSVVRYAPDGDTLFTAGDDGTIRQWDAVSARQVRVIPGTGMVNLLAVSPDGKSLAAAARAPVSAVRVWDLVSGRRRQDWRGKIDLARTEALAFSSDGNLLLFYGSQHGLTAGDIATGREQAVVQPRFVLPKEQGSDYLMNSSAFAAGNRLLALCTTSTVHVADLATGDERFSSPGIAMAFAPDGRSLAIATTPSSEEGKLAGEGPWNAGGLELVDINFGGRRRIGVPKDRVSSLAFSPDGKVVAVELGWRNSKIRLYSTDNGREIEAFTSPATRAHPGALTFSPDGRSLAAGCDDTTVVIWGVSHVP